ncbi:MAG: hypothetical protein COB36_00580 [Alphaproteobacteria bacterium]|nr:MAG: hypothetical protein COB36_00580 [Alphaproteobacteria bacterium]
MTEEAQTEEDPSIEEILDSIRQIISEDEEGGDAPQEDATPEAPAEEAPVAEAAPEPEAESEPEPEPASDEPLDQSAIDDMDFDTPAPAPVAEAAPEPEAEPEPASDEPMDQSAVDDIDFDSPAPAPVAAEPAPAEPEPAEDDDILELTDRVDEEPEAEVAAEPEPTPVPEPEIAPEEPVAAAPADSSLLTQGAEAAAFDAISELARKTAVDHNGITLEDIVRGEIKPLLRVWLDKNLPVVIERLVREELERVSKRVLDE